MVLQMVAMVGILGGDQVVLYGCQGVAGGCMVFYVVAMVIGDVVMVF